MASIASSSNPLVSSIVTIYILVLLYSPHVSLRLVLSPLLIPTFILLLSLLRLGVSQSQQIKPHDDSFRAETRSSSELGPESLDDVGKENFPRQVEGKEEECHRNQSSTEPGPGLKPKPEPTRLVPGQEEEGEEEGAQLHYDKVETRPSIEPGTEPESIFIRLDQGRVENIYPSQCEKGEEADRQWDRAATRPSTEPEPITLDQGSAEINPFQEQQEQKQHGSRGPGSNPKPQYMGAPLEVIYEAYEGEELEDCPNDVFHDRNDHIGLIERHPSLSLYYPEYSDSGSGSDSESSSSSWTGEFPRMDRWDEEEEEEREGLIEISLDCCGNGAKQEVKKFVQEVQFDDEDNLIEIDISPTRNDHGGLELISTVSASPRRDFIS